MRSTLFATLTAATAVAGCAATPPPADPTGRANADMLRVLTAYQATGAKSVAGLSVAEARGQPTIGDVAASVAQQMGKGKTPVASVRDIQISGLPGGLPLPARVYDPQASGGPAPVILYFRGGGWVTGDLNTYDASDRALAAGTGAIVVSLQYRLAPENRFPAAQDDADAAYAWLLKNAGTIGADPRRIALAGESAGGNIAIDTAIWARDQHLPPPVHQLLVYPVAGTDLETPSYKETTEAIPLNRKAIAWYVANTVNSPADLKDTRLNVLGADLHGLPPTTIVLAEIDPLRSEGEVLAQSLTAAGVPTEQRTYPGVTHEFFGMGGAVAQAKMAEDFASMRLKAAFSTTPKPMGPVRRQTRRHGS